MSDFKFSGSKIAENYDSVLVPVLFDPWATHLLEMVPFKRDGQILDLACGTGIVASKIAPLLGDDGRLTCADASPDMLEVAKARLTDVNATFEVSPAESLPFDDATFDNIYCQQGFQFFSDRTAAANEMLRVMKSGATAAVACWCPIAECEFFDAIAQSLREAGLDEIASKMGIPFDHMPAEKLRAPFDESGFSEVNVERVTMQMIFGDTDHAHRVIYGTPIGPDLKALPDEKRTTLNSRFAELINQYETDAGVSTSISSLVLIARK